MDEQVKVDAIVVGGGPAGIAAAYTLAKHGCDVIVIERGEYCGSKNVGGLLYTTILEQIVPDCHQTAPIERSVAKRQIFFLGDGQHAALTFGADTWTKPPYNYTYTVHRSQFDRWFAAQAEEAGASLLEGMVVDELIYEGDGPDRKAKGVRIRGDDEEFLADTVILADGAHSILSKKVMKEMGFNGKVDAQDYAVGVKEIIGLPRKVIEDRFGLTGDAGCACDFIGIPFKGVVGGGFLYTQKETLALGFATRIETLQRHGVHAHDLMDHFKRHPEVAKFVRDGELLEYSAHMIPEGGYNAMPPLVGNGVLITGDAAGLVNVSLYKEGTNHAMESGKLAAEAVIAAKKSGDFSRHGLASYETAMKQSVAVADLKKYRDLATILETTPEVLQAYPARVTNMMVEYFTNAHESKAAIQKRAFRNFLSGLPKFKFLRDSIRARKLL